MIKVIVMMMIMMIITTSSNLKLGKCIHSQIRVMFVQKRLNYLLLNIDTSSTRKNDPEISVGLIIVSLI